MSSSYQDVLRKAGLMPLEEMLQSPTAPKKLTLGIPREVAPGEHRIPLDPDSAGLLVQHGHRILMENEAGKSAHFFDHEFSEAGVEIVYDKKEIFSSDIILKVSPPTAAEIGMMRPRQTLLSSIHATGVDESYFQGLIAKKVTALAFEYIQDRSGSLPIIRAMSEIAGNTSLLIAAEYLSNPDFGRGKMLGGFSGISPTEVVILGAGTVGEFAARAALGMGATVKIFDNSVSKLRRLQSNLNMRVFTSMLQPKVLRSALMTADVAIGAMRSPSGRSPMVVSESMVQTMKSGSVIIDVSIDQGGCFETSRITSHSEPVYKLHGVTHYCVPNIASKVPHTASFALSNILTNILLRFGDEGGAEQVLRKDFSIRQGVYLFNGTPTNAVLCHNFHLPYQDINLLMDTFG